MRAATPRGSSAPAAAAAAMASAAEEPRPLATGIWDRTVMDRRSVPATSMATRAARWDGSSDRPAPSPSDRTIEPGRRFHLDLHVEVECDGQGVETGAEVGSRRWSSCAHTDTVLVVGCHGRNRGGRPPARPPAPEDRSAVDQTPPPRRLGQGTGDRAAERTRSVRRGRRARDRPDGRPRLPVERRRTSRPRRPSAPASPSSHALCEAIAPTRWDVPFQSAVADIEQLAAGDHRHLDHGRLGGIEERLDDGPGVAERVHDLEIAGRNGGRGGLGR